MEIYGMDCLIGIDIGTSGCKIMAVDEHCRILKAVTEQYPCYSPKAGWSEQEPEDWWTTGVCKGLKTIAAAVTGSRIRAVGFSGQMHGMVALDRNGHPVRRAILWNDQRTEKQCEEITECAGGLDGLLSVTDNRMLTGYTGGKILWMKENEPENYEKTKLVLNPKDYIRFRLSGRACTDVSDASGTGFFNVRERKWSFGLIEKAGLKPSLFPPAVESTSLAGRVTKEAAAETGLPEGTPLAGGGGDAVISMVGLGLIKPGRIGITLGTSGVVAMNLPAFAPNPGGMLQIFCGNEPGTYSAIGVTLSAAGSYQWFRNIFGDWEAEEAKKKNGDVFTVLDHEAAAVPAGSEGLIFLPYLTGERAPLNDPDAKGAFLGITSRHAKGHFARSVLEGVAFSLRQVYELIERMESRNPPKEIALAGGGAKSQTWRQIFADVFHLPVRTVYGGSEGGAFGAALVAGVTGGVWKDLSKTVPLLEPQSTALPKTENSHVYESQYAKYVKFYDALKWSY